MRERKGNRIFKGCKGIAKKLESVRKRRIQVVRQLDYSAKFCKELLLEKIQDNLIIQCTKREKEFLNLKMADGKKLLDYIIGQFDVSESLVSGLYSFKMGTLLIHITDSEINDNGFYFDTGRNEISKIIYSIFTEKLGISVSEAFDHNDIYALTVWSGSKAYVPF